MVPDELEEEMVEPDDEDDIVVPDELEEEMVAPDDEDEVLLELFSQ